MTCNEELWPIFDEFEELAYTNMVRREDGEEKNADAIKAADRRMNRLYWDAQNIMNRYHPELKKAAAV